MILESLRVDPADLERSTGWVIKPEGACKNDQCIRLPASVGSRVDARVLADRLGMPLIHDQASNLWCLGPEASGRALSSARAPDLALPDWQGREYHLGSLRGLKVLLVAWASW